ncbi:MAG: Gfo/Idh/MocA family protein, partial [Vicinamibacterales bacterium]
IIGLDTSHVVAFTNRLNAENKPEEFAGIRIVAAYPKGSPDIESSVSRVPKYTEAVQAKGVEIVDSIDALIERVDVVFLETNDGRPHLEQVLPVLKAGKPVFVDKPVAGSLADAIAIFEASKKYKTPVFSSSSLRYTDGTQALRNGELGRILSCDAYSPASLEPTHPDLYWYGIHGVEILFTVMGTGCESVSRAHADDMDVVVGTWEGGRIGTYRGFRTRMSPAYGGMAYGEKGVKPIDATRKQGGSYDGLLIEIVEFFKTGKVPVEPAETLEIYAFMSAADESKRRGGEPVSIAEIMAKAREEAKRRLAELDR